MKQIVFTQGQDKYKTCSTCKEARPIDWYCKNVSEKDGMSHQCKTCRQTTARIYRQSERGKMIKKNQRKKTVAGGKYHDSYRGANLKRKYGITLADYNNMFESQAGECKTCHKKYIRLCVDHNHESGQVRGLLCPACNNAIGFVRESQETLENIIAYLSDFNRTGRAPGRCEVLLTRSLEN